MSTVTQVHISYILQEIAFLKGAYTGDINTLKSDPVLQRAVLRALQTLCESCKKIEDNVAPKLPDVPWKQIIGMRNVIVHEYVRGIDYRIVDDVIKQDMPKLEKALSGYLKEVGL